MSFSGEKCTLFSVQLSHSPSSHVPRVLRTYPTIDSCARGLQPSMWASIGESWCPSTRRMMTSSTRTMRGRWRLEGALLDCVLRGSVNLENSLNFVSLLHSVTLVLFRCLQFSFTNNYEISKIAKFAENAPSTRWPTCARTSSRAPAMLRLVTVALMRLRYLQIFDATNTTKERRCFLLENTNKRGFKVLFVESICNDEKIVEANIQVRELQIYAYLCKLQDVKVNSPDYKGMDQEKAKADFLRRIEHYRWVDWLIWLIYFILDRATSRCARRTKTIYRLFALSMLDDRFMCIMYSVCWLIDWSIN